MTQQTPITLATLPDATDQQVFDQVARHLLTQRIRSESPESLDFCLYRGPNGLKCAAGCLIADDEYSPEMEGTLWEKLANVPDHHIKLISDLQGIHDLGYPDNWRDHLHTLACHHGLSPAVLSEFPS